MKKKKTEPPIRPKPAKAEPAAKYVFTGKPDLLDSSDSETESCEFEDSKNSGSEEELASIMPSTIGSSGSTTEEVDFMVGLGVGEDGLGVGVDGEEELFAEKVGLDVGVGVGVTDADGVGVGLAVGLGVGVGLGVAELVRTI